MIPRKPRSRVSIKALGLSLDEVARAANILNLMDGHFGPLDPKPDMLLVQRVVSAVVDAAPPSERKAIAALIQRRPAVRLRGV